MKTFKEQIAEIIDNNVIQDENLDGEYETYVNESIMADDLEILFNKQMKINALELFQKYAQDLDRVLGLDDNDSKIIRENFPKELGGENE